MDFIEIKQNKGFKYLHEGQDLKLEITSDNKLDADTLDQILFDLVLGKGIMKGHNKDFKFEAIKKKHEWSEENERQLDMIKETKDIKAWRKKNIWKYYLGFSLFTLLVIYIIIKIYL